MTTITDVIERRKKLREYAQDTASDIRRDGVIETFRRRRQMNATERPLKRMWEKTRARLRPKKKKQEYQEYQENQGGSPSGARAPTDEKVSTISSKIRGGSVP